MTIDPEIIRKAVEETLIGQFDSPLLPLLTAEGQLRARIKRIALHAATRAAEMQREADAEKVLGVQRLPADTGLMLEFLANLILDGRTE